MTVRERLAALFSSFDASLPPVPPATRSDHEHVAIAEAMGDLYPASDDPLTTNFWPTLDGTEPITGLNLQRAYRIQQRLWEQNAVHHRIHELIRDFVYGLGIDITVSAKDANLYGVTDSILRRINDTYSGPKNRLDLKLPAMILERSIFGTLGIPVSVEEATGQCTFGFIPATWIRDITVSDSDVTQATKMNTSRGTWVEHSNDVKWDKRTDRWLDVIRYDNSPDQLDESGKTIITGKAKLPKPNPNYGKLVGNVFLLRSNHLLNQTFGRGDTFAISDFLNYLDQGIYDSVTALELQRGIISDVTIKNGTKDEIERWSKVKIPRNKIFAHTDRISMELKSPEIKMEEVTALIRLLLLLSVGSAGIPEFVFGDGSQTNVATAVEQMPALYAKFNQKRKEWAADLQFIFRYVMIQQNNAGMIKDDTGQTRRLSEDELSSITINVTFTPFERNNMDRIADSIQKFASGIQVLSDTGLISKETARKTAWNILSQLGVSIEAETEKALLEREASE